MNIKVKNMLMHNVFPIIEAARHIERHADFFYWMQNSVTEIIPHETLLVAWGDFENETIDNRLSYDVSSSAQGLSTKEVWCHAEDADACLTALYLRWKYGGREWFILDNLSEADSAVNLKAIFPKHLHNVTSALVYGISDLRGGNDCLYVFLGASPYTEVSGSAISLLVPYVDHTLRRVKHLVRPDEMTYAASGLSFTGLSERELEVIEWIKAGKTNEEIGMILSISQNTVKSHLKRIFQKLNVSKRAQAIAMLATMELTKPDEMHVH